jgi:hypothetical protein
MRQRVSPREHLRRGNATRALIVAEHSGAGGSVEWRDAAPQIPQTCVDGPRNSALHDAIAGTAVRIPVAEG